MRVLDQTRPLQAWQARLQALVSVHWPVIATIVPRLKTALRISTQPLHLRRDRQKTRVDPQAAQHYRQTKNPNLLALMTRRTKRIQALYSLSIPAASNISWPAATMSCAIFRSL